VPIRIVRRPKSPHWIMRGTLRGIRLEESTGTDDKHAAEEIRAKREAEILAESVYGRRVTATFASAALSYLENDGSKRFLEPVIKHFGTTPLAQIGQDAIDRMARKLYPNASDATRNRQAYTPASAVMRQVLSPASPRASPMVPVSCHGLLGTSVTAWSCGKLPGRQAR